MNREFAEQFNQEVNRYRNVLLYAARTSDWAAFKARAGGLFDYLELVESSERERRFFTVFIAILAALVAGVILLMAADFNGTTAMLEVRRACILAALAVSGYELFFFVNFRLYTDARKSGYVRRRKKFILGIEQDFRSFTCQTQSRAA